MNSSLLHKHTRATSLDVKYLVVISYLTSYSWDVIIASISLYCRVKSIVMSLWTYNKIGKAARRKLGTTVTIGPFMPNGLCTPFTCSHLVVEHKWRVRTESQSLWNSGCFHLTRGNIFVSLFSRNENGEKVKDRQKTIGIHCQTITPTHQLHFFGHILTYSRLNKVLSSCEILIL